MKGWHVADNTYRSCEKMPLSFQRIFFGQKF